MRVGLIDFDSKQVNLALMKLSAYHKTQGDTVILNPTSAAQVDKVYCSVLFSWNRDAALRLSEIFPNIEFGGTGYDLTTVLPAEIETMRPDYDLYTAEVIKKRIKGIMKKETRQKKAAEIVNAGIGFTSRGCIRACDFCVVPQKEGRLHSVGSLADLVNPRSNIITLLDNNLTADPDCLGKLKEARERKLVLDITQGIDVRLVTPEIAQALADVKHLRSLHYSWDLIYSEQPVTEGIALLSRFVKTWKHLCYTLVGFNTTFEEDMYRFSRLSELGVDPYVMIYRGEGGVSDPFEKLRLQHFARWINGRFSKSCSFAEYVPWIEAQQQPLLMAV